MDSRKLTCAAALALLVGLAVTARLGAQNQQENAKQLHYRAFNLALNGGTAGLGTSLNNLGWVMGSDNLAGDQIEVATVWISGAKFPLGTLGGDNSDMQWPNHNDRGELVGISETAMLDPLLEDWSCFAFIPAFTPTFHQCVGFLWKHGHMTALPTLGGTHGFGAAINNNGQAVGWAETTFHDPTCVTPQVLQFEAVIWEPDGTVRQLPAFGTDADTAATAINDKGQVVGISGDCDVAVGATSARHAVMWENGNVIDLGSFGSAGWNTPMAINSRGDVAGFANTLPDNFVNGQLKSHPTAFLWTKDKGIQNLGTLPGDTKSIAYGINNRGQVVGQSYGGANGHRAFLYQDGKMTDLNQALVSTSPTLSLLLAQDINDSGEITGEAFDSATVTAPAFLAIPVNAGDREASVSAAQAEGDAQKVALPESVRMRLEQRWPFRRAESRTTTPQ